MSHAGWPRFALAVAAVGLWFALAWFLPPALLPAGAYHSLATPLDARVPYWPWMAPIYLTGYLLPLWPLAAVPDPRTLERGLRGVAAMIALAFACFLLFPVAVPAPPWRAEAAPALALRAIEAVGARRGNCFPSLHVAIATYVALGMYTIRHWSRHAAALVAVAIAWSAVALRLHWLVDLPAGAALGALCHARWARRPLLEWAGRLRSG